MIKRYSAYFQFVTPNIVLFRGRYTDEFTIGQRIILRPSDTVYEIIQIEPLQPPLFGNVGLGSYLTLREVDNGNVFQHC